VRYDRRVQKPLRVLGWTAVGAGIFGGALTFVLTVLAGFVYLAGYEPPSPMFQLPPASEGKPSIGVIPIEHAGRYTIDAWGTDVRDCALDVTGPRDTKLHDDSKGALCRVELVAKDGDRYDVKAVVRGSGTSYVSLRPVYDTPSPFTKMKWAALVCLGLIVAGVVLLVVGRRPAPSPDGR